MATQSYTTLFFINRCKCIYGTYCIFPFRSLVFEISLQKRFNDNNICMFGTQESKLLGMTALFSNKGQLCNTFIFIHLQVRLFMLKSKQSNVWMKWFCTYVLMGLKNIKLWQSVHHMEWLWKRLLSPKWPTRTKQLILLPLECNQELCKKLTHPSSIYQNLGIMHLAWNLLESSNVILAKHSTGGTLILSLYSWTQDYSGRYDLYFVWYHPSLTETWQYGSIFGYKRL